MEKGTRLTSLLQTLDRVLSREEALIPSFSTDEYQQLRLLTSRVLQNISSQEKRVRDIVLKNANYLNRLLYLLEHSKDKITSLNVIFILTEAIGRTNTNKRLSLLVSHGTTQVLFQVLVSESKKTETSDDLLIAVHQLLAKLGPKDNKFGVKARLFQTLGLTLNLLQSNSSNARLLLPITQVLKLYAGDGVNSSFLGKNGAVSCLLRTFVLCQRRHLLLLKCSLDALSRLVKSKSNASLAVDEGGVSTLIGMFSDWHRLDTRNRHIALRKSIVLALKNITEFKSGQQALIEADGVRILYYACQEAIECAELESLICMASAIVRKCFPRCHLPVASLQNPLVFDLTALEYTNNYNATTKATLKEESCLDDDDYDDDNISSDDDDDNHKVCESEDEDDFGVPFENCFKRYWEDLLSSYKQFFSELYEYDTAVDRIDSTLNDVKALLSSKPNPLNKSFCRSSVDLHKCDRSMIESSPAQSLNKSLQQNQTMDFGVPSAPLSSAPDLFESGGRRLPFASGRESCDNVWPGGAFSQANNLSKGSVAYLCSPKWKRRTQSKTINGKTKERPKNRAAKQLADDWTLFDLSAAVSNLLPSKGSCGNDARDRTVFSEDDDEDDDRALLFGRKEMSDERVKDPALYSELAAETLSIASFTKIAYPELFGHSTPSFKEPFYEKKIGVQRQMILEDIDRFINPDQIIDRVVYDLDALVSDQSVPTELGNNDEQRLSGISFTSDALVFNSLFESGNLRKVIQIRPFEYDLILTPDVGTNRFSQWFYFEVSNMQRNVSYRFNIINCEKINSQFNFGMQPVMFSVSEAILGRPFWSRVGSRICYYKNHFARNAQTTGGVRGKTYFTTSFTITFCHERDVCYIAYHYPYTYTTLQYHLRNWETKHEDSTSVHFRSQVLCKSLGGNSVPLLTLTSKPSSNSREAVCQMKNRPYVFLTSRVHPGESNASWIMKGTIDFLLSDHPTAKALRENYIFKIVPMLNPDGVINGNHRCSLVAEDLNRRWFCPCPRRHPTVFHTKGLLQFLTCVDRAPLVFCDYHGHSRRKNVFLYGCSPSESWMKDDCDNPAVLPSQMEDFGYKSLPKILQSIAPAFSLSNCSFAVERAKETTARVVVWRQMQVLRSYTMESTYCGCDQGIYKGKQISTRHLAKMGRRLVEALAWLKVKQTANSSNIHLISGDGIDDLPFSCDGCTTTEAASDLLNSSASISSSHSDTDEYVASNELNVEHNCKDN